MLKIVDSSISLRICRSFPQSNDVTLLCRA
jgi:hypothetical protein